jgi:hypothetical protein
VLIVFGTNDLSSYVQHTYVKVFISDGFPHLLTTIKTISSISFVLFLYSWEFFFWKNLYFEFFGENFGYFGDHYQVSNGRAKIHCSPAGKRI